MDARKNGKPPGWIYETSLESLPADMRDVFREACTGVGIVDEDVVHALLLAQTKILDGAYKGLRKDVLATIDEKIAPLSARIESLNAQLAQQHDHLRKDLQTQTGDLVRRETALAAEKAKGWQTKALNYGAIGIAALLLGGWLVYFFDAKRVSDVEAKSEARSEERVKALMAGLPYATRLELLLERRGGRMESQPGRLIIHPGKNVIKNAYRDPMTGDAVIVHQ